MKSLIKVTLVLALLAIPKLTYAQANNICANNANLRSVNVNISSATTTRLVDNSTSSTRYIVPCNLTLTIIGAAAPNGLTFISGTGTTCGTGTVTLTGLMSGPGAATDTAFWPWPMFPFGRLTNGHSFCVTTTTVQQVSGILTWVFVGPV